LEDVDSVSCPSAVDSEEAVCVTLHRVSIRVHCHEDFVELEAGATEIKKSLGKREEWTYYMAKPPKTV
jgi:hypothetical protein